MSVGVMKDYKLIKNIIILLKEEKKKRSSWVIPSLLYLCANRKSNFDLLHCLTRL
jgi:hypothetical protein